MRRSRGLPNPFWRGPSGLVLSLLAVLATEAFGHVLGAPAPLPAILLLSGLVGVAYASLRGGFAWGAACAALLSLYTLHYVSPHGRLVDASMTTFRSGAAMLVIALGLAAPLAVLGKRERRLRHALEARNRELEARNRDLTEANAALEAFGYVVSHDLKEPVRAVENYLEAADEEYGTESGRAHLRTAREANRRLHRMLHGLLAYSRASSLSTSERPLDVAEVLATDACRSQYEGVLRERSATLDVQPGLPRVLADEVILAQWLGNVVLNAVRHNPRPRPTVRVRAGDAPEGRVHLVVEDDGHGFPPEVLHRVEGLRPARPATVKGGFGLVIAQRAAERMAGRMWLENAPEGGGRVHLDLPAAPPASPKVQVPAGT